MKEVKVLFSSEERAVCLVLLRMTAHFCECVGHMWT
jgi:hypothetical protein